MRSNPFLDLKRLCDAEIASGNYVTLGREFWSDRVTETIQCFNGVMITRTFDKAGGNLHGYYDTPIVQSDEDNGEDIEDTEESATT
jgi:hypothetical protein